MRLNKCLNFLFCIMLYLPIFDFGFNYFCESLIIDYTSKDTLSNFFNSNPFTTIYNNLFEIVGFTSNNISLMLSSWLAWATILLLFWLVFKIFTYFFKIFGSWRS